MSVWSLNILVETAATHVRISLHKNRTDSPELQSYKLSAIFSIPHFLINPTFGCIKMFLSNWSNLF